MSKPARPRERLLLLDTNVISAAPTNGTTQPHFELGLIGANGLPVVGFSLALLNPDSGGGATSAGAGFTITLWRLQPTTRMWLSWNAYTAYAYFQQLVTYDFGGGTQLYIQVTSITANGNVLAACGELT